MYGLLKYHEKEDTEDFAAKIVLAVGLVVLVLTVDEHDDVAKCEDVKEERGGDLVPRRNHNRLAQKSGVRPELKDELVNNRWDVHNEGIENESEDSLGVVPFSNRQNQEYDVGDYIDD